MIAIAMLVGCGVMAGAGVGAEYRFPLESPATFVVHATSDVKRAQAKSVGLGLLVQFEDGEEREPIRVDVEIDGEVITLDSDLDANSLFFEARGAELFPCPETCRSTVTYTLRPEFDGPRDVYLSFDLLAQGTEADFPAWDFLDLGVEAPQVAFP